MSCGQGFAAVTLIRNVNRPDAFAGVTGMTKLYRRMILLPGGTREYEEER
jgi:hypothetical protein